MGSPVQNKFQLTRKDEMKDPMNAKQEDDGGGTVTLS